MPDSAAVFSAELLAKQQQIEWLISQQEDETDQVILLLDEYCQQLAVELAAMSETKTEHYAEALTIQQQWLKQMSKLIKLTKQQTAESLLLLQKSRKASDGYTEHNT